jgi:hypothetical protein
MNNYAALNYNTKIKVLHPKGYNPIMNLLYLCENRIQQAKEGFLRKKDGEEKPTGLAI